MYYRIIVCGQIDEQGGGLHAELRGEVYGYQFGCVEAFGDIEGRAVDGDTCY